MIHIPPSVSGDWKSCLIEWILVLTSFHGIFHGSEIVFPWHHTLVFPWCQWNNETVSQLDISFFHLFSRLPSLLLTGCYPPIHFVKISEISKHLLNFCLVLWIIFLFVPCLQQRIILVYFSAVILLLYETLEIKMIILTRYTILK